MLGQASVVEFDPEAWPIRGQEIAVTQLDHRVDEVGPAGSSCGTCSCSSQFGTHMPSWTWAATATGPDGTACGSTPAWNDSASAQIFLTCVMPPAMPTSGLT